MIPFGLVIAGTAVASHLLDSGLAIVPVLLLVPSGFLAWRALMRLDGRALPDRGAAEKGVAEAGDARAISHLIPLWTLLGAGGALILLTAYSPLGGRAHSGIMPELIDLPITAAIAFGQWWLLRRAGVSPMWILGTLVAELFAQHLAQSDTSRPSPQRSAACSARWR